MESVMKSRRRLLLHLHLHLHPQQLALIIFLVHLFVFAGFSNSQTSSSSGSAFDREPSSSCDPAAPYSSCTNSSRTNPYTKRTCTIIADCDESQPQTALLPTLEVKAYNNMTSMLNITSAPSASSVCSSNAVQPTGFNITCSCTQNTSTNSTTCNVIYIVIWNMDLRGVVPEALSGFTSLQSLVLSNLSLHGAIPDSLGDLSSLQVLGLQHNRLSGPIPESFKKLESLVALDVTANMLSDSVPSFLGTLTNLKYISLSNNQFSGTLPPEIGNLQDLVALEVWCNKLTGRIPDKYAQLRSLSSFVVDGNNMSGSIPSFFSTFTNLTNLGLLGNNFEGTLPPEIFTFSNLNYLAVSDLRNSSFQFPLMANLTSIVTLIMRNCSISGVIPSYIGDMSSLQYLDLGFNNITGGIPDSLNNLSSLAKISLAGNKLNGTFPYWARYKGRPVMDISYNNLQVSENFWLQNQPTMNLFDCCSPSSTSEELNMISLSESMNRSCPDDKSKHNSLFINCGGGEIYAPNKYYANNDNTSNSHISSEGKWAYSCSGESRAKGPISYVKQAKCGLSDLYGAARYCPVSLTYYGFCLENGTYTVQLFFSEIAYADEEDTRDRIFDVYIQDELRLKDFNIKEKAGGSCKPWNETMTVHVTSSLLKIQLFWAGKGYYDMAGPLISAISATATANNNVNGGYRKLSLPLRVLIALAIFLFSSLLSLYFIWKMCWSGKRNQLHGKRLQLRGESSVTVKQLIDATGNFSQNMEIGKGGFGTVYKAKVCGQIVAVKKLSAKSTQGIDELRKEVYALKCLRHENLVQLLDGYSGNDIHLLVYEYVENNSLERALFDPSLRLELNWKTRYNIILGIAKGLNYLHKESRLKIIHRDIKPSNVLLDEKLKAKISDFGLATLYNKHENQVSEVAGTDGYMAPEYAMRGNLSDKVDIYSFGVLLLEIISGKRSAEQKVAQENIFLLDIAYNYQKEGRLIDLVDKKLFPLDNDREKMESILSLAMMCTNQSPSLRPDISEVLSVLEGHKTIKQVSYVDHTPPASNDVKNTGYTSNSSAATTVATTSITYVIK